MYELTLRIFHVQRPLERKLFVGPRPDDLGNRELDSFEV